VGKASDEDGLQFEFCLRILLPEHYAEDRRQLSARPTRMIPTAPKNVLQAGAQIFD
jgi:hypothetical protein